MKWIRQKKQMKWIRQAQTDEVDQTTTDRSGLNQNRQMKWVRQEQTDEVDWTSTDRQSNLGDEAGKRKHCHLKN